MGVLNLFLVTLCVTTLIKANPDKLSDQICETPSCVTTAATVLKNMDAKINPCDNFYQFACGGFDKFTIVPEDKSSVSTYGLTRDLAQNQLYSVLQNPLPNNTLEAFKKIQKFYFSCLDLETPEKNGIAPIIKLLDKFGGWPVLSGDKWDESKFDWKETMFKFLNEGFGHYQIFDSTITPDLKNTSRRILEIDQGAYGISVEYFAQGKCHKVVKGYLEYMIDIAVMLGANRETAEQELEMSFEFERKLAGISLKNEQRRNASLLYNPMTVAQLQTNYPYINWLDTMNRFLAPWHTIDQNEVIIVNVPSYFENLKPILEETPKRVTANYLLWTIVNSVVTYLPKRFRDRRLQFSSASSGKTTRSQRWQECVDKTSGRFGVGIGSLYVRNFFDPDAKAEALDMVKNLRSVFLGMLDKLDWMDAETKGKAVLKAKAMTNHIAYPDELLDDSKIEDFYKAVVPDDDFLQYNLNLNKFSADFTLKRFRLPVNKTEWIGHGRSSVVNAFYSPLENSIQFPAAIFQGTFFAKDRPRYMNYGCIGFTVGHEITHGFDDNGRQFDKNGDLVDWWNYETKEAFIKKAQCIIDQYSNFTVNVNGTDKNLNGVTSQGENIADNGGLKESYYAYQNWAKGQEPEPRLPGLKYTPNQMFWISAANKWCSKYKQELLEYLVLNDPHVPGVFRINGPMSNIPEFSKDYNCPKGSKMNPEKKCAVW